jgi:cytoskeletal protein RodZ
MDMAPQGMTVGRLLQKEREEKKVSLESVAQKTRIQLAFLQALEEDAFQLIPSELYVRGFIRSYAKSIHLNPDEILDLYRTQAEPPPTPEREPSSFSNRHLKQVKNHLFDFLTTMAGGTPAYSLGKSVFRPKD